MLQVQSLRVLPLQLCTFNAARKLRPEPAKPWLSATGGWQLPTFGGHAGAVEAAAAANTACKLLEHRVSDPAFRVA